MYIPLVVVGGCECSRRDRIHSASTKQLPPIQHRAMSTHHAVHRAPGQGVPMARWRSAVRVRTHSSRVAETRDPWKGTNATIQSPRPPLFQTASNQPTPRLRQICHLITRDTGAHPVARAAVKTDLQLPLRRRAARACPAVPLGQNENRNENERFQSTAPMEQRLLQQLWWNRLRDLSNTVLYSTILLIENDSSPGRLTAHHVFTAPIPPHWVQLASQLTTTATIAFECFTALTHPDPCFPPTGLLCAQPCRAFSRANNVTL